MNYKTGLVLFLVVAVPLIATPLYAQDVSLEASDTPSKSLPELALIVDEFEGTVESRRKDNPNWSSVETGEELKEGDHIRTADGSTVALLIPSIAYVGLEENTTMDVNTLLRSTEEQGVIVQEDITINEIEFDVDTGEIKNSIRDIEDVENDYKVRTPNAVAGVRGTDFGGRVSPDRASSFSVLNGEIQVTNRNTNNSRIITSGQRTELFPEDTIAERPEEITQGEKEDIQNHAKKAEKNLPSDPLLESLELNGEPLDQKGEGVYRASLNYSTIRELTLRGIAKVQEEGAEIDRVTVKRGADQLPVEGKANFQTQLTPEPPREGKQDVVNLVIKIFDTLGTQSRAYPVKITLNNTGEFVGVPENLEGGNLPIEVTSIGGQSPGSLDFPYQVSGKDVMNSVAGGTGIEARGGIAIRGRVNTDSEVRGVAYSLDGGANWNRASQSKNWAFNIPIDRLQNQNLSVRVVAWTAQSLGQEKQIGQFTMNTDDMVLPASSKSGNIQIQLSSVGGKSVTEGDFPVKRTSDQLPEGGLVIEGSVESETPVSGVAVSLDDGQNWTRISSSENFQFQVPLQESRNIEPVLMAWVQGDIVSQPYRPGVIEYQKVEEKSPFEYPQGNVSVEVTEIGGRSAGRIQFPYQISEQDLMNSYAGSGTGVLSGNGIPIQGRVETDSAVKGVAYSLDGGENWEKMQGTRRWSFRIPLDRIENQDVSVRVVAWTNNFIGNPEQIGPFTINTQDMVLPSTASPGDVNIQITSVAGQSLSSQDFPLSLTNQELPEEGLVIEGNVASDSPVTGVAVSLNEGQNWTRVSSDDNFAFQIPIDGDQQLRPVLMAWTQGDVASEPFRPGQIQYTVVPDDQPDQDQDQPPWQYEQGNVPVEIDRIAGMNPSDMEFPYQLYSGDVSPDGIRIAGTASGDSTIEGVAYSLDGGENWTQVNGGSAWTITLPAQGSGEYDLEIMAWTVGGVRGEAVSPGVLDYENVSYSNVVRQNFYDQWNTFSNQNRSQFMQNYSSNFEYTDSLTGVSQTKTDFENFLSDFFSGIRNLNVFTSINQILTGRNSGEIEFNVEWRGVDDDTDRPFIMFAQDSLMKFRRQNNGEYRVTSLEDFPFILYLFNRTELRVGDLEGFIVKTLEIKKEKEDADIIAELGPPSNFVANKKISIGGHITAGGIKKLNASSFGGVESIPNIGSGYEKNVPISEGNLYAVNIRDNFGDPSTALVRVEDLQSDIYVGIQVLSAQAPPGIREEAFVNYRGINPYE